MPFPHHPLAPVPGELLRDPLPRPTLEELKYVVWVPDDDTRQAAIRLELTVPLVDDIARKEMALACLDIMRRQHERERERERERAAPPGRHLRLESRG